MIQFHDYDPTHPFDVTNEKHIITDYKITLNYTPLKGSVSISGYTEDSTGTLANAAFYIDYDEENNYRSANQIVRFSPDAEGKEVSISYKGVSTLLRAKHLNEIKDYMERGVPLLVANMIIAHESALIGYFDDRINGLTAAIKEVSDSVASVAAALGGLGGDGRQEEQSGSYDGGDIGDDGDLIIYDGGDIDVEEPTVQENTVINDGGNLDEEEEDTVIYDGGEI